MMKVVCLPCLVHHTTLYGHHLVSGCKSSADGTDSLLIKSQTLVSERAHFQILVSERAHFQILVSERAHLQTLVSKRAHLQTLVSERAHLQTLVSTQTY